MCHWTPSWQRTALISPERLGRRHGGAVWEAEDEARIILPVNHICGGFGKGKKNKDSKTRRHRWKPPDQYFKACRRSQPCMSSPFGSGCCWVISGWTEGGLICSSISSQSSEHCDQRRVSQNFAGRVRAKLCSHSRRVEISEVSLSFLWFHLILGCLMSARGSLDHC